MAPFLRSCDVDPQQALWPMRLRARAMDRSYREGVVGQLRFGVTAVSAAAPEDGKKERGRSRTRGSGGSGKIREGSIGFRPAAPVPANESDDPPETVPVLMDTEMGEFEEIDLGPGSDWENILKPEDDDFGEWDEDLLIDFDNHNILWVDLDSGGDDEWLVLAPYLHHSDWMEDSATSPASTEFKGALKTSSMPWNGKLVESRENATVQDTESEAGPSHVPHATKSGNGKKRTVTEVADEAELQALGSEDVNTQQQMDQAARKRKSLLAARLRARDNKHAVDSPYDKNPSHSNPPPPNGGFLEPYRYYTY